MPNDSSVKPNQFLKVISHRTLSIAAFLFILVFFPVFFSGSEHRQDTRSRAQTPGTYVVYGSGNTGDSLNSNWKNNLIFGPSVKLTNTNPVFAGTLSLSFNQTGQWEYFELVPKTPPFDISTYKYLTFYAQATIPGQIYTVQLLAVDGTPIGASQQLDIYGGAPLPDRWNAYNFPLADFNAGTTQIGGFRFKGVGGYQPAIYLDEIAFTSAPVRNLTPTPGIGPPGAPPPSLTPVPDYFPSISPWVYIVPGLIIFLAVMFQ